MSSPRLPDDQQAILDRMRGGRRIVPVVYRRGSKVEARLGFSDREPVHAQSLGGLVRRGIVERRDGAFVLREPAHD